MLNVFKNTFGLQLIFDIDDNNTGLEQGDINCMQIYETDKFLRITTIGSMEVEG
jgi:NADH/NAD ratio-sensing transcriptional regulator Rex